MQCKMHQCLSIVEVQYAIFRQVHNTPEGKATLARLARSCRTFSNAALDVLWEALDSFVYLIRCLPTDLWKVDPAGERMTFQRDMSVNDWDTFFSYSSRVRILYAFGSLDRCPSSLSPDVILTLTQPPNYGPLVPHLKTLFWHEQDKEYVPLLQQLFARSLVDVELPHFVLHSHAMSMQLASRCPSLRKLRTQAVGIPEQNPDLVGRNIQVLSGTILRLHSLISLHLDIGVLDEAAITHLSHLPSLIELSLELQDDLRLENVKPRLIPPAFASLESLSLMANELSTFTSLLEFMQLKLQGASFTAVYNPTPEQFHLFFIALVNACDSEQLSQIDLHVESPDEWLPWTNREQVSLSTFLPLLELPNLKSFKFNAMCNISFDDDAIDTLTKHWPKLTCLYVNASHRWGVPSHVSHRGLITLLSHCPALSEFGLTVDFTEIDLPCSQIPISRPGNGYASCCQSAFFIESAINHPITIAAFLSDICPGLKVESCMYTMDEESSYLPVYGKRWKEVNYLLPAFSAVRKQGMEWPKR